MFVDFAYIDVLGAKIAAVDLYGFVVLLVFVITMLFIISFSFRLKNNPYFLYVVSNGLLDRSVKKIPLYEVDITGNMPIASFKGYGLLGNKGLYIPFTDTVYEIPDVFYLKGYDSNKLFFKRVGKIGILPLRVFGFTIDEVKIKEFEEKEKEYLKAVDDYKKSVIAKPLSPPERPVFKVDTDGGVLAISTVDAKMTLLLTDSYISTFYRKLASISLQTRDSFESLLKEHAPEITMVLMAFITLLLTAWGASQIIAEAGKVIKGG